MQSPSLVIFSNLEEQYVKDTWFEVIDGQTGAIGAAADNIAATAEYKPDEWPDGVDAIACGLDGSNRPNFIPVYDASGNEINVSSFTTTGDYSGDYSLSHLPTGDLALVYRYRIQRRYYDESKSLGDFDVDGLKVEDVLGAENQIVVTDNGDRTITISLPAVVLAKLVTNGDSHDHSDGDGAPVPDDGLAESYLLADGTRVVTGDLEINTSADPKLKISENIEAGCLELTDANSTQASIKKTSASGNVYLDLDPAPQDGSGNGLVRMFRATNTTGTKGLILYKGDNTTTIYGRIDTSGGNSYFQIGGGNLCIGDAASGVSLDKGLVIHNGTPPTGNISGIQLFSDSGELKVRDASGNVTTLSPHNFSLFTPDSNEMFPWSYYSENSHLGKRINIDMAGVVRAVESLSGKQFVFYEDITQTSLEDEQKERWKAGWIIDHTTESEVALEKALEQVDLEVDSEEVDYEEPFYDLDQDQVKEKKKQVFVKSVKKQWRLKPGLRFCSNTGKCYQKIVPGEAEAEAAARAGFTPEIPAWLAARLGEE